MHPIAKLLLMLIAAFAANAGMAQTPTVSVRAGEHADYTRLILQLPEQNQWRLSSNSIPARLEIIGPTLEFDLSETFSRIPRTRLRDIRDRQAGLDLYVGCNCDIQAREDVPQFLIIDIIGTGSIAAFAPSRSPRPPMRPMMPDIEPTNATTNPQRAGTLLAQTLRGGAGSQTLSPPLALISLAGTTPPDARDAAYGPEPAKTPQHAQITRELGRVLASSVSSGVLRATTEFTHLPASAPKSDTVAAIVTGAPDAHFVVQGLGGAQAAGQPASPELCPNKEFLDLADWFFVTDPSTLSPRLDDLFTDLDKTNLPEIYTLAKHFIYLGFGAEARMVLSLLPVVEGSAELLTAISYLVDGDDATRGPDLAHLAECGPMGSLWAFLANTEALAPVGFPMNDLVQAIQMLPAHLRLHLGPAVVQRLAGMDLTEQARVIRAALDRVAQEEQPGLVLARATLDLPEAGPEQAHMLETLLTPRTSDDDLIFLLSRRDVREEVVEETLMEAATTRLFAVRGTQAGQEIASLVIRAKARAGEFRQAFDLLEGRDVALNQASIQSLGSTILEHLTLHAGDAEFVTHVFEQRPWDMTFLSPSLLAQLGERLRGLGFTLQANLLEERTLQTGQNMYQSQPGMVEVAGLTQAPQSGRVGAEIRNTAAGASVSELRDLNTATSTPMPALADTPPDDPGILRARAAQQTQRSRDSGSSSRAPFPEQRAREPQTTFETPVTVTDATDPDTGPVDSEPTIIPREPDLERPLEGMDQGAGLLSQGRNALDESADLRTRLQALLDQDASP